MSILSIIYSFNWYIYNGRIHIKLLLLLLLRVFFGHVVIVLRKEMTCVRRPKCEASVIYVSGLCFRSQLCKACKKRFAFPRGMMLYDVLHSIHMCVLFCRPKAFYKIFTLNSIFLPLEILKYLLHV